MNRRGHFFCEGKCDDVKPNVQFTGEVLVRCPDCRQLTCHWVPDKAPRREKVDVLASEPTEAVHHVSGVEFAATAAQWFAEMHRVVEAAG